MIRINHISALYLAILGTLLVGCSKSETTDKKGPPSLADASNTSKVVEDIKKKAAAEEPKADPKTPIESYKKLDSGRPLLFTHLAISGMPIDFDQVASALSQDYRRTSDEFKKRDIINALKPGIEQEVASAKAQRYYYMLVRSTLQNYKFDTKAFPLGNAVGSDSYYSFDDASGYSLNWNNSPKFQEIKVEDETVARQIESMRSQYDSTAYKVYFFISGVELGTKKLRTEITKIQLLDKRGSVLAEM